MERWDESNYKSRIDAVLIDLIHSVNVQHPMYKEYKGALLVSSNDENINMDVVKYMQLNSNVNDIVENSMRTFIDKLLISAVEKKSMDKNKKGNKVESVIIFLALVVLQCYHLTKNFTKRYFNIA